MPVPGYGVLIGGISDRRLATPKKNHYEVRVEAAGASYRLAILRMWLRHAAQLQKPRQSVAALP